MSEADPVDVPKEPRIIKRYSNRKLYDTVESRYVTLEEIAEVIKAGGEVRIIDNRSKEDLTSGTLAQIILEGEKKQASVPLGTLRDLVRHGGEALTGFFQQQVGQVGQRVASIREEAGSLRDRIWRKEGDLAPSQPPAPAPAPTEAEVHKAKTIDQARELLTQSQRVLEGWQKRIDEHVHDTVDRISSLPAIAKNMASLEKRIAEMEKKLEELEKD